MKTRKVKKKEREKKKTPKGRIQKKCGKDSNTGSKSDAFVMQ